MQRHPQFALWRHDDGELATALDTVVVRRSLLQQWPLSCVERVECADGRVLIYKSQAAPSVEPDFYQCARSPLLVSAQVLPVPDGPAAIVLPYVDGTRLCDLKLAPGAALELADRVVAAIARIEGTLPAVDDLRLPDAWSNCGVRMAADLRTLAAGGNHHAVDAQLIARVERGTAGASIHRALNGPLGYVHGDLLASNVLVLDDELRVLDWQRPLWGPVDLDRAALLESLGVDPRPHVAAGVLHMRSLLAIGWFAAQAVRWFPPGEAWFVAELVRVAEQLEVDA